VKNLQLKLELGKGITMEEGREEKSRERWRQEGEKKRARERGGVMRERRRR
jgi:hypothetical protein